MKKIIVILLCAFALASCTTLFPPKTVESNIRKVQVDMTRAQVLNIMGSKNFIPIKATRTSEGSLETLGYDVPDTNERYVFEFVDDHLTSWNRISIRGGNRSTNQNDGQK